MPSTNQQCTFQPQINDRSRTYCSTVPKAPVTERLYSAQPKSKDEIEHLRREKEEEEMKQYVS